MEENKKSQLRTKLIQDTHDIHVEPTSNDIEANKNDTKVSCCSQCSQGFKKCMPCYWNNADNKLALFGLTDEEKFVWEQRFEFVVGVGDFITDMLYFSSVLHAKISDSSVNADVMRAFLFISAILGLSSSSSPHTNYLLGRNTEIDTEQFRALVWLRTTFEDMPQIIITLVIEHYRFQNHLSDGLSRLSMLNIAWSILSMVQANHNTLINDERTWKGHCHPLHISNTIPCLITVFVLFAF